MYSQCPRCSTRQTVTAALLRATRGDFRCGQCGDRFDGIATLSDDAPAANVETFGHELAAIAATLAREAQPALTMAQHSLDTAPHTDDDPALPPSEFPAFDSTDEGQDPFDIPVEQDPGPIIPSDQQLGANHRPPVTESAATRRRYAVIAVPLALLLIGQLVNGFAESLVTVPALGPWLTQLYAALGQHLEPRVDPTSFEIQRASRSSTEVAGQLTLHALIINHATHAQPLPLVRVTLEDANGTRVGRREFQPNEYLPDQNSSHRTTMTPDERAEVSLTLVDPGADAVGFKLEACVRQEQTSRCGSDTRSSPTPP
jgi:predicted Zn finger-like uncharacterized protein